MAMHAVPPAKLSRTPKGYAVPPLRNPGIEQALALLHDASNLKLKQ